MKNLILLLSFFFLNLVSYGQIKFNGSFNTGYEDRLVGFHDTAFNTLKPGIYFKNNIYCAIELKGEFRGFSFYAMNKTSFFPYNITKYNFELNQYQFGASYTHNIFTIGYNHMRSNTHNLFTRKYNYIHPSTINRKEFGEAYDRVFLNLNLHNLNLISKERIRFGGTMEMGIEKRYFMFQDSSYLDRYYITHLRYNFYSILSLDCEFKGFSFYAMNKTYFNPDNLFSYNPLLVEYILGAKYTVKKITFGWEHMCAHAIEEKYFRDGYDRFYLRFNLFNKTFNKK